MISHSIYLWLISLSIITSSPSMLLQTVLFHSFLWVGFHCICIYHIFLIQSFVGGHLGCFYILAIVYSAAMNTGVHVFFKVSVFIFFRYIPRSGIVGHRVILFLVFWGTVSIVAVPISIHTNDVRGFPFLHIPTNVCYLWSFWWWPFWPVWRAQGGAWSEKAEVGVRETHEDTP